MEDREIIERLFDRSECALEELSCKYRSLSFSVMRKVLENDSDVEECFNDVLLCVWNSIPPKSPENLGAYVCTLSRNAAINRSKYNNRQKRNSGFTVMLSEIDELLPSNEDLNAPFEEERLKNTLNDFLRSLDEGTRVLFLRRYLYLESPSELAVRFGLTENLVNVRLFRARKKLKKILEKEDFFV